MKTVAVLVGSLRDASINLRLGKALERLAAGRLAFKYIEIGDLPHYDDGHWTNPPPAVLRLKDDIASADAVLFITPEYNRSIPGVLKNAIDWASRPWGQNSWSGKPAAIIGTTPGATGTAQAQAHLRSVMTILDVALMGAPEVYFQTKPGLIDDAFDVTDEQTKAFLSGYVTKFADWIDRIGPAHAKAEAAE